MIDQHANVQNSTEIGTERIEASVATVRSQILQAAEERIRQYGYGKTTMTEIAGDCTMSAANLYRYFKNKADLVAVLAQDCLRQRLDHMDELFAQTELTASERVERWIIDTVEKTYDEWVEIPHMGQLVDDVCRTNPEIVRDHQGEKHRRLCALIQSGIDAGEFVSLDTETASDIASAIVSATILFGVPHFMILAEVDDHRKSARRVAMLVARALRPTCASITPLTSTSTSN